MAVMLGALYKALLEPNEENARKASEEVAAYDNRIAQIERDLTLLKWMVGTNIVLTLFLLGKVMTL